MSTVNLKSKPRKHGAGVYALATAHDGGRIYVGESIDLYTRWKEHGSALAKGTHHNRELQHLYNNGANTSGAKGESAIDAVAILFELLKRFAIETLLFIKASIPPLTSSSAPIKGQSLPQIIRSSIIGL